MPMYTFKCRTCDDVKEELRSMGNLKEPLCERCAYNPEAQGKYEKMARVFKPNARPGSENGSWGFGGKTK